MCTNTCHTRTHRCVNLLLLATSKQYAAHLNIGEMGKTNHVYFSLFEIFLMFAMFLNQINIKLNQFKFYLMDVANLN